MGAPALALCVHPAWEPAYGGLLRRCAACGLHATAAAPRFGYDDGYFTGDDAGGYDFDSAFAVAHDDARFWPEIERLERQGLRGSILDVGCATGRFLAIASGRGWAVSGVEVSRFGREQARSRLGALVVESLADLEPGSAFDVVTMHHVLEHVHDPLALLRDEVRPRVKKRLLVEVPNFASLASRARGPRWRDLRPDQHVFHYTDRTLSSLVAAAGFRVLSVYTLCDPLVSPRTVRELAQDLPALVRAPDFGAGDVATLPPPSAPTEIPWPPMGARRALAFASRVLLAPVRGALAATGLGERLVLEAAPSGER